MMTNLHFLKKLPALKGTDKRRKCGLWIHDTLELLDKRTRIAKAAARLGKEIVEHVGQPTILEQVIIHDIVSLFVELKLYECNLLKDKSPGSRDRRLAFSNTLRHHCVALRLRRDKQKPVDLAEYLSKKSKGDTNG